MRFLPPKNEQSTPQPPPPAPIADEAPAPPAEPTARITPRNEILLGDCVDVMRRIPDDYFTAVCTDPPYGLAFMNKGWDKVLPPKEAWAEALRVTKPGGMLLAFSGSRTFHRLTCDIEDAGWEIRDCLMWLYGSGFPKSLDVSKAIDKAGGVSPSEMSRILKDRRTNAGLSREDVAEAVGCTPSSIRDWEEGRARESGRPAEFITPSAQYRERLSVLLGYTSDERRACGVSADRRGDGTSYALGHSGQLTQGGQTGASLPWVGYGTALKPAWEPVVLAMKPIPTTFADNALTHGVAGINVDGCRIATDDVLGRTNNGREVYDPSSYCMAAKERTTFDRSDQAGGRWPSNTIIDESTAADLGPHARYFYTAKSSPKDRNLGLKNTPLKNTHATVKPTALMRYLIRLVTMPQGTFILDPFAGSGSTGVAARLEGVDFVGIEREPEYHEIASTRFKNVGN